MNLDKARSWAVPAAALAALLLVFDLFLTWHRVSVEVAGVIDVEGSSSGWHGWGFLAGALAVGVIVATVVRRAGVATIAVFAVGSLAATMLAAFTGEASVDVAGVVGVEVSRTAWPAWVGLALAAAMAIAALLPLVADRAEPRRHAAAWHPSR